MKIKRMIDRIHTGSITIQKSKVKNANRLFIKVVPNEERKFRTYDAVPEWFTAEAPLTG